MTHLNGPDICPNCNTACAVTDVLCPNCGENLDELFEQIDLKKKGLFRARHYATFILAIVGLTLLTCVTLGAGSFVLLSISQEQILASGQPTFTICTGVLLHPEPKIGIWWHSDLLMLETAYEGAPYTLCRHVYREWLDFFPPGYGVEFP